MLDLVTRDSPGDATVDTVAVTTHEQLLARVARGDQAAFAELYDAVSARVLGLVRRVLHDPSQSEEVTQEVFLEIWQTATRYQEGIAKAMTWILTIAHRRAVDRVRASQSSRDRDTRVGIRDFEREFDHVAETVEVTIEHERVARALAGLSEIQRQALTLAYYGGYSHSEVASMLDVPVGTIKTRLRDGLIRLRSELGVTG